MKNLVVLLIILSLLFSGCAIFKKGACSTTAAQIIEAGNMLAQIADMLPWLEGNPIAAITVTALKAVMPVLKNIQAGFCISDQENFFLYVLDLITRADIQAQKVSNYPGLRKMGLKK